MAITATYDPALTTDKDWVRLLVADRDLDKAVLDDAEITALLSVHPNRYYAAAEAVFLIIAKTKGIVDKQVGDLRIQWGGSTRDAYTKYAQHLRELGAETSLKVNNKQTAFKVL